MLIPQITSFLVPGWLCSFLHCASGGSYVCHPGWVLNRLDLVPSLYVRDREVSSLHKKGISVGSQAAVLIWSTHRFSYSSALNGWRGISGLQKMAWKVNNNMLCFQLRSDQDTAFLAGSAGIFIPGKMLLA